MIFRDNPGAQRVSDSAAFHEIDDAVRKDAMKEWWNRYGTWVVAAAVVVVVASIGCRDLPQDWHGDVLW